MLNVLSIIIGVILLVVTLVALIPFLGWLNWLGLLIGAVGLLVPKCGLERNNQLGRTQIRAARLVHATHARRKPIRAFPSPPSWATAPPVFAGESLDGGSSR